MNDLNYLLARSIIDPDTNCWIWQRAVQYCGYGKAKFGNKIQSSHRIAWQLANGEIPEGAWVLHTCDNRLCVNPAHLFLGDIHSNTADKVAKGRQNKGEAVPQSKLTAEQVLEIRAKWPATNMTQLGLQYGVSRPKISAIIHRKNWKHI